MFFSTQRLALLVITLLLSFFSQGQTVGISDNAAYTVNPNSILDLDDGSGTKGLLVPRMTTSLMNTLGSSLTSVDDGLLIYDTDLKMVKYWNGTSLTWNTVSIGSGSDAFTTTSNVTSNAPGTYATDDFVFGSSQLDDDGNADHDRRMFFDKSKAAFRAGRAPGTEWDDANVGNSSTALGYNTTASGPWSTAINQSTTASGASSIAMGQCSTASGGGATAMGQVSTASGEGATSVGQYTTASGDGSTAMGHYTTAPSFTETAIGTYNTAYTPNSATVWDANDRLLVVGNGTGTGVNSSDAMVILKNGNTGIGTSTPTAALEVASDILVNGLTIGRGSAVNSTNSAIGANALPNLSSGTINNTAIGYVALLDNVSGNSNTAVGAYALTNATGNTNTGVGTYSLSANTSGYWNSALGYGSLGGNTTGYRNVAVGVNTGNGITTGNLNTMIGYNADVSTGALTNATAIGANTVVSQSNSVILGNSADVGIGTSAPSAKLDVEGTFQLKDGTEGAGKVLTSDANGNAYWQNQNLATYSVGDFALGGVVCWVDESGQHGLVCAMTDQSAAVRWYAGSNGNTRALGNGPLAGEANTILIIATQVFLGDDGSTYAARICNEYQVTQGGKTYGDWYLPSAGEWSAMYQSKATINASLTANGGNIIGNDIFWSSTEQTSSSAMYCNFSSGNVSNWAPKNHSNRVRAVRAF